MRESERKLVQKNNQNKRVSRPERKGQRVPEKNGRKVLKGKETGIKASSSKQDSHTLVSDLNTRTDHHEVHETIAMHYVDDFNKSDETTRESEQLEMVGKESNNDFSGYSCEQENDSTKVEIEDESDPETVPDSVSSHGDPQTAEEENIEKAYDSSLLAPSANSDNNLQSNVSKYAPKNAFKSAKGLSTVPTNSINGNSKNIKVHPKTMSESSEEGNDGLLGEQAHTKDEASSSNQSFGSDDEAVHTAEHVDTEGKASLEQKVLEMESKIEKLHEELREVAALEVALYSVVPEHGNSSHKVHTPARRLSRLYIHACKYWSQDKRATVARNIVSGLVLVSKSCGNDVPRLTFWLSNVVVLREIISQAFGSSCSSSSITQVHESNGRKTCDWKNSSLKRISNSGSTQLEKNGVLQFIEDWQESRTFTVALGRVESWIFSRIVESIWWQAFTPNMQSHINDLSAKKAVGKLFEPALGDQLQGRLSIDLWKDAFEDASKRLCHVRAGGQECGCLPVLARRVMKQCVARLDVAMFNAILRESAHEIPTDPVSDPIVESKVLPIPAGDLSFGSGAQLKKSIGTWSRWLTELFGMSVDESGEDALGNTENRGGGNERNHFNLLNALSDLLMLPKDMLMDSTIRMEVCPSIHLSLLKRILCNFSPDEFCPDPVPGAVLEAVNAECIIERRLSTEPMGSFPYPAAPVVYTPPSSADLAEKVAELDRKSRFSRTSSSIQRKGHTSDEELDEIGYPLASIVPYKTTSPTAHSQNGDVEGRLGPNVRYELLREVWRAT
ncbi:hypothetical protein DM860_010534 [Cuscuta australis]|uniref:Dilute domain-containing protein n=1 Tax=Cuscuta australis TaxID=267555 RepID=A0A328E339_9ASTE|nr:hypothetical protein DM860_010534 [Cuscuta australis]